MPPRDSAGSRAAPTQKGTLSSTIWGTRSKRSSMRKENRKCTFKYLVIRTDSQVDQCLKNPPVVQETQVSDPWVGQMPWRKARLPMPVF